MRLILVRHGESEGNAAGIIQGRLEFGLTALGRAQALATAERLRDDGVERVISSPLRRAFETASIIAGRAGHDVEADEALAEYDIGAASGLTVPQLREQFPDLIAARMRGEPWEFPGEEGREAFASRVRGFVTSLGETPGTVVAVAHGGVIGAIAGYVVGLQPAHRGAFDTANCAVSEVIRDRQGRLVLKFMNDTCHLDGLVTEADRG